MSLVPLGKKGGQGRFLFCSFLFLAVSLHAAELNEARVTQVVNDVKILPEQSAPRPAVVSDAVRDKTAVRTGTQSRSELTFNDQSITRLGANTIFSFERGTRVMNLGEGAILFQVPKGSGGAIIKTAAVTAAITGTTGIGEFHAGTGAHAKPIVKWFCLEGTIHVSLTNGSGEKVVLKAGQMIASDGTKLPQPASFNIAALKRTSLFFVGFKTPLPSLDLINVAANNQIDLQAANEIMANNVPATQDSTNIIDHVDQGMTAQESQQSVSPTPSASPTPTATVSPSVTPTPTATVSPSGTPTPTATVSPSVTPTPTATVSPSATPTPTATVSPSVTPTPTATVSPTVTPTPTITPTPSPGTATATYTNAPNGNWSDPAVWTPNVVPNNGNNGDTYDAIISGGTLTQDITDGVTIQQLFMNGGTLFLTNPLTLNAGLHYIGGTIRDGVLNVAGVSDQSTTMGVNNTTINNSGEYDLTFDGASVFNGGNSVFNNSGILTKSAGSGILTFNIPLNNTGTFSSQSGTLQITTSGSSAGTFAANAGAILEFANDYTFTGGATFSGEGIIEIDNNHDAHMSGGLHNSGTIMFNAAANLTRLVLDGDTTLDGGGTVALASLNGSSNGQITGGFRLTNVDNIIQGEGNLGANLSSFTNQADGVIDANVSGRALFLDPASVANAFVNQGLLEATNGGLLQLSGNAGGAFTNTNGLILADGVGSEVQLLNNVSITGGMLNTLNGGVVRTVAGQIAFLSNLTNTGNLVNDNNADTHISGTITNSGTITLNAAANVTRLFLDNDTTLNGGGTVTLTGTNAQITGGFRLTNFNNLIQGFGNLGANSTEFLNQANGIVAANVGGQTLFVDPSANGFVNQGLLEATGAGILQLSGNAGGAFLNTGATILADGNGSEVQLLSNVSITGGTLMTTNGGLFRVLGGQIAFLTNVNVAGPFIDDNNADTHINGTIANTGAITLNAAANLTRLYLDGDTTLNGGGTVTLASLNASSNAQITGAFRLTNVDNIIQGEGNLGGNLSSFTNQAGGVIDADVNGRVLFLDPANVANAFVNHGLLEATNGGILQLSGSSGGDFTNTGATILANGASSEVQLLSSVRVTGGILSAINGGIIRTVAGQSVFLTNLTIGNNLITDNNADTHINGTITNNGTITLNAAANLTRLYLDANTTLNGGGTVTLASLNGSSNAQIAGPFRLTNVNNIIQGEGNLGANVSSFTNQSGGVIDANVSGRVLFLDPSMWPTLSSIRDSGGDQWRHSAIERRLRGRFHEHGGTILANGARLGSAIT